MDERDLHEYRREPDPQFASELRAKLRRTERSSAPSRVGRWVALAAAAAAVAIIVTVPSVRVQAEAILDTFRVKRFAAVEFKPARKEMLDKIDAGKGFWVIEQEERIKDPGEPHFVASRDAAGSEVGFAVKAPSYLPDKLAADSIFVQGDGATRFTVSEEKVRTLLEKLDLRDVKVPSGIDGQWVEVKKPSMVMQRFRSEKRRAMLIQARSPEVSLPAGWDLAQLGEIGLRVLGLDASDARRIAKSTDWKSTLMVPLPMDATTFRQVKIHGQPALLITTAGQKPAEGQPQRQGTMVLWSSGDKIFCLQGDLAARDALQMAESVS